MAYYKVLIESGVTGIQRTAPSKKWSGMFCLAKTLFVLCRKSLRSPIVRKTSTTKRR